jgi:PPP family 3-phenylpropionic acid transporter
VGVLPSATKMSSTAQKALAVSLIFGATSAVIGVHMPFLPVWFDWIGLSAYQIALLGAAPVFVRILTIPVAGYFADRWGRAPEMVLWMSLAAILGFLALTQMRGFGFVLAAVVFQAFVWSPVFPLSETVAMGIIKRTGLDYGRMRLWGSVTFIVTNCAGGWAIERVGAQSVVWFLVALVALTAVAAFVLLRVVRGDDDTGAPVVHAARRISPADVASLVARRDFRLFLLSTGAVQSSHAVLYVFGILHWRAHGISAEWASVLWTISILFEIALFAWSRQVLQRFDPVKMIAIGCAAGVVRWGVMGLDPGLLLLVPLQMAHALTFASSHIGAIHYLTRTVPEHQMGTAQALYSAFTGGIATGVAMLAIGPLYANFGGRAYWAMAVVSIAGLAASLAIGRARTPA